MISAEDTKKQDILNLRKTFDNTIDKLREQYFSRIFEGGADDDISIEKINQDLNLNFQEGTFLVLNLIYGQVENEPEVNEKVLKVMWECGLPSVCIGIVALTINYKIVIILNYKTEVSKLVLKHVNEFFDNIFDKRISNEIVLSIGTEEQSIKGLRNSYYNANIIAFGRLNQGVNRIYNSRDYAQLDKDIPIDPEIDIRLKQAFNSNSRAAVISIINKRVMELTIMNSRNPIAVYVGINHILKLLYENTRNTSKDSDEWMEYFEAKKAKIQAATSKGAILSIFSAIVEDIINYKTHDELNRNEILIGDAKKYIDNNYMSDISLDDVSKIVQLNPNYFCEIFRKETGYNFKEYLSLRRVEAAKELLKNVSYKITDISNLVGYNDARHFSKMFKKYVGITPSEYRRLIVGYE